VRQSELVPQRVSTLVDLLGVLAAGLLVDDVLDLVDGFLGLLRVALRVVLDLVQPSTGHDLPPLVPTRSPHAGAALNADTTDEQHVSPDEKVAYSRACS
jgi:hypothetical protein